MKKFCQICVVTFLCLTLFLCFSSSAPGRTHMEPATIGNAALLSSPDAFIPQQATISGDSTTHKAVKEYGIQVGAFSKKKNAIRLQQKIQAAGYRVDIYENFIDGKQLLYLVWVGIYLSEEDAQPDLTAIKSNFNIDGVIRPRTVSRR